MALPAGSRAGSIDVAQRRLPAPVSVSVCATRSRRTAARSLESEETMSAMPKWQNICT